MKFVRPEDLKVKVSDLIDTTPMEISWWVLTCKKCGREWIFNEEPPAEPLPEHVCVKYGGTAIVVLENIIKTPEK